MKQEAAHAMAPWQSGIASSTIVRPCSSATLLQTANDMEFNDRNALDNAINEKTELRVHLFVFEVQTCF